MMSLHNIVLTHSGRVMHICISKLTIIGSDNCLLPGQHQAIIWTCVGIVLIGPLGTNFNAIWTVKIHTFSIKKKHLNVLSGKWQPFCLSFNMLIHGGLNKITVILQTFIMSAKWWLFCSFFEMQFPYWTGLYFDSNSTYLVPNHNLDQWQSGSRMPCGVTWPQWTGIILCMCPANERQCYIVTSSLIGWTLSTTF